MIEFQSLSIRHFRSWQRLDIDLSDQGVSCIQGETGAGKSSIFSALFWGLYGKLPEDTRADEVRGSKKPTAVRIVLRRENQKYVITRYRGHMEYKGKVFFKGPGIPLVVEDSYVKTVQGLINRFLGVSETIFLTTTYFAQRNFHHFHSLTDTQKKAFIESITYGSLFETCEAKTREIVREQERKIDKLEGQLLGLEQSIKEIHTHTEEQKRQLKKEIHQSKQKIESINEHLNKLRNASEKLYHFTEEKYNLEDNIETQEYKIRSLEEDIERYEMPTAPCPRCGLTMLDSLKKERINDAQRSITKLRERLDGLRSKLPEITGGYEKYKNTQKWIVEKEREKSLLQSGIKSRRTQLASVGDSTELRRSCTEISKEILHLKRELIYKSFWLKGFSFQGLRAYVLINAIRYLSSQIERYLQRVMGERIEFHMTLENNRLLTECNGRSYASLSGGERQAVDLCTGLAMRDLAGQYNKSQFNILILDEPFENFDKHLTSVAQSLLLDYSKPSTFLITHRELSTNFDKVMEIYKVNGKSKFRKVYGY